MLFTTLTRWVNLQKPDLALIGISPKIVEILLKSQKKIGRYRLKVFNYRYGYIKVLKGSPTILSQIVNISEQPCNCGKWAIYKIPYTHALAVLTKWRINYE